MGTAACYLRQSVDKLGDELAISRQREDCLKLCEERGWTPVEYTDNDISATSGKRPAYEQMLADIRAGGIDAVVAWDLDRLHRRPIELEHFIDLADEKHLALATVGGDADLSTDSGRLFARIKGAVARAEVERKSARQKRAMRRPTREGPGARERSASRKTGTGLSSARPERSVGPAPHCPCGRLSLLDRCPMEQGQHRNRERKHVDWQDSSTGSPQPTQRWTARIQRRDRWQGQLASHCARKMFGAA